VLTWDECQNRPPYRGMSSLSLKQLLKNIAEQMANLLQAEEQLQQSLIRCDFNRIRETQPHRDLLQQRLQHLERERAELVPHGSSIRAYIEREVAESEREHCLSLLESIRESLQRLHALQEVNRSLLQEQLFLLRKYKSKICPHQGYNSSGVSSYYLSEAAVKVDCSC